MLFPDFQAPVSPYATSDHDGDGIQDVVAPLVASDPNAPGTGSAKVFSGWTGQELYELVSPTTNDLFGFSTLGVPDITGDGKDELLVGAPASDTSAALAGRAYLYSGADGALLTTFAGLAANGTFGLALSSIGDLDADGRAELAVSAPFDGNGKVFVFFSSSIIAADGSFTPVISTANANLTFAGEAAGDLFGFSIASAGDVTGDGLDDFLVGAPGYDGASGVATDNRGRAYLYSGQGGALLGTITGATSAELLGYSVATAGDLDSDTRADVMIGAPGDPALANDGRTHLFYAADLMLAPPFDKTSLNANLSLDADAAFNTGQNTDGLFGFFVAQGNDVDADGKRDLIAHAGIRDAAGDLTKTRGYMFSGADGSFLFTFTADGPPPPPPPVDPNVPTLNQITVVLYNFGMDPATFQQGDLNGDQCVNIPDVIIALTNPNGTPPASTAAPGGGSVDCNQIIPMTDANGMPIDPCATPMGGGSGGGDPLSNPFDPTTGQWDPCRDIRNNLPDPPLTADDCFIIATCIAADAVKNDYNTAVDAVRTANDNFDDAVSAASQLWNQTSNPNATPAAGSPHATAESKRVTDIGKANATLALKGLTPIGAAGVVSVCVLYIGAGGVVNPIGWAGCVAAGLTFIGDGAVVVAEHLQAIDAANAAFNSNPGKVAFDSATAAAQAAKDPVLAAAAQQFASLDAMLNDIYQMKNTACLAQLGPTP